MKLYVVVSFMRKLRGAMYEVQSIYESEAIAIEEILHAAQEQGVELEKVEGSERSWKGEGVIVTVHEVDLERAGIARIAPPSFVLGEEPFPIGTKLEGEGFEVTPARVDPDRVLKPRVDSPSELLLEAHRAMNEAAGVSLPWPMLRAHVRKLRTRIAKAIELARNEIAKPAPVSAPPRVLWSIIDALDPEHTTDDGD